jgi:hypothetical protein
MDGRLDGWKDGWYKHLPVLAEPGSVFAKNEAPSIASE